MSAREAEGQLEIGGADGLLQAETASRPSRAYLALSVTRGQNGEVSVHRTHMAPGQARVAVEWLDSWGVRSDEMQQASGMTDAEVLLYWAQQLVYRERGALW